MLSADFFVWRKVSRKMRDSNPRYPEEGIPDFESSAFGHSANLPLSEMQMQMQKYYFSSIRQKIRRKF